MTDVYVARIIGNTSERTAAIMTATSTLPGVEYQAAMPGPSATCDGDMCRSKAVVRLIMPRPVITGCDDDSPLAVWDMCDLHWPSFRWACEASGHPVTDTTGSLRGLAEEFPAWNVWCSDDRRLYAATYTTGRDGRHGTTMHAWLAGQLRAEMQAIEAGHAPATGSWNTR